jgi:predicted nuclease of predicted toxin-antitoxin system
MKLLFDQNISYRISKKLIDFPITSLHVSECDLYEVEDLQIWNYAHKNNFAIVTFDSDFYDLAILQGHPPKVIWLRTGNLPTNQLVELLIRNQELIVDFLTAPTYSIMSCLEIGK